VGSDFPRLVSLACHDLRTPLATVQGFAKTLLRQETADERSARWLELIDAASNEVVGLLDELSAVARIEGGRYDPVTREADSLELARGAVPGAAGAGAPVQVDVEAVERSLAALARAASRHGGVEIGMTVQGERVELGPVVPEAATIVLGEELKDFGAAVAVRVLGALGATVELEGDRLAVTLPASAPA
jgi:signal transduction histidine kinase